MLVYKDNVDSIECLKRWNVERKCFFFLFFSLYKWFPCYINNHWNDWNTINAMCRRSTMSNIYYHFSPTFIRFFLSLNWYHTRQGGTFRSSVVIFLDSNGNHVLHRLFFVVRNIWFLPFDKSRKQARKSDLPIAKYKCSNCIPLDDGSWPIEKCSLWLYELIFNNNWII